jgi:hypothetical protein
MRVALGGSRIRWVMFGGASAGLVALLSASTVFSQPTIAGRVPDRVRELEERVARLEQRLLAMERMVDRGVQARSVRSFPLHDDVLGYSSCDPPFAYDERGTRLLKAGCEAHGGGEPCDPPFVVDAEGIKTLRAGCETTPVAAPCMPPFAIDEHGNRVVRRECLDVGY